MPRPAAHGFVGHDHTVPVFSVDLADPLDYSASPPTASPRSPPTCAGTTGCTGAHAIQVLTISGNRLNRIVSFNDAGLRVFGLPSIAAAQN